MERYNYKLTIAYDGTNYSGWQIQPNAVSIQELIQKALTTILREDIFVIGSGRTDAGVHAYGQVANFTSCQLLNLHKLSHSLNGMLPRDIRVTSIEEAPLSFHSQYSAIGKIYHYHLWLDSVIDPMRRFYTTQIIGPFDQSAFLSASKHFIGEKDFSSFANQASEGSAAKNPVRTIHRLDIIPQTGGLRLEFEGDGFLYKMVRNITGTLIDCALGKINENTIVSLLEAKDRRLAGRSAPAKGLFLMQVFYP